MLLETGVRDLSGLIALYLFAPPGYRVTIQNRCCYRRRGRSARRGGKKIERIGMGRCGNGREGYSSRVQLGICWEMLFQEQVKQ